MLIGDRLREFREAKHLSQGDIEKRTGLFRSYVSRVENGHSVPVTAATKKGGIVRFLLVDRSPFIFRSRGNDRTPIDQLSRKTWCRVRALLAAPLSSSPVSGIPGSQGELRVSD